MIMIEEAAVWARGCVAEGAVYDKSCSYENGKRNLK